MSKRHIFSLRRNKSLFQAFVYAFVSFDKFGAAVTNENKIILLPIKKAGAAIFIDWSTEKHELGNITLSTCKFSSAVAEDMY